MSQKTAYPLDYTKATDGNADAPRPPSTGRLSETVESVVTQAKEYEARGVAVLAGIQPFLRRNLKDHPQATLSVGVAVGFILGAIWKR